MKNRQPLLRFDPNALARYERDNYVAYYQKAWLKLLGASVGMVREAFGLNLLQAVNGAYLIARAEQAFAPFPDNDLPRTAMYLRRFFRFITQVHQLDLDIEKAVQAEIGWWLAHRQCFGSQDNQELVDALVRAYASEYGAEPAQVYQPAYHRAGHTVSGR